MGNLTVKTSNLAVTATYENAEKQLKFELNYNQDMNTKRTQQTFAVPSLVFSKLIEEK
jgi:hypothetical protein